MSPADSVILVACAGALALGLVVALRGGRSPLALPLALPLVLLTLAIVCWSFAALAYRTTHLPGWRLLDIATAPFCVPLTLHFALAFTGRVRRWRTLVIVTYLVFGAYALLAGLSSRIPGLAPLAADVLPWSRVTMLASVAVIAVSFALLLTHLRAATGDERGRTWLLLLALGVVSVLGPTDYWLPPPLHLGALGALLGVGILALATLRFQLFDKDLPTSAAAETLVLAGIAFVSYFGAFQLLRRNHALLTLTLALVTLALFAGLRYVFGAFAARRERVERLATLGTFSAQLAHDLKNPLAALKGAAQYLKEEIRSGRNSEGQAEYCDLIAGQVDRLDRIVDRYQRLGHLEPARESLRINDLVENALRLQRFAGGQPLAAQMKIQAELSSDLPTCQADKDLLSVVLDNLLRNAAEAMPDGGTLTIRTAKEREEILLSVEDTGVGMSPRTRERAFDGFFTTKAQGSGLGLAFVRRVAEAHGGGVSLTSEVGRGTVVRLHLPVE